MKHCIPAALAVTFLWAGVASAQASLDRPTVEKVERAVAERSYGEETLLTDLGALSAFTAAALDQNHNQSSTLVGLGVATYLLGGPIVHAAEGHPDKAVASLGLRVGAPFAGAMMGYALGSGVCSNDQGEFPCPAQVAILGFLSGAVAAIAIDSSVIAVEPDPSGAQGLHFAPSVSVTKGGVGAGLMGAF